MLFRTLFCSPKLLIETFLYRSYSIYYNKLLIEKYRYIATLQPYFHIQSMSPLTDFSLVLWWWGARWYVHLGVLKYLEEHEIVPSQIIWTSMWAIIGGAWAVGLTADQIIDALKSISRTSLFDVDFKTASIQWDLVEKLLTNTLWNIQIEDIQIPYGCTATCLEDWTSTLFTNGPLIDAIRASISVPGLFSPQSIDWCTYIDWWLTANLPIQYAFYDDVIAISAARAQDLEIERTSQFWKREIPKNPLAINKEILSKSYNLLLNTQENQAIALSDKNITLIRPYNSLRLLDMEKIDDGVALGYAEAERVLGDNYNWTLKVETK